MGPFEVSYLAFSAILPCRGVPAGVVYAGSSVVYSEVEVAHDGLEQRVDGAITEQL